jgi:hypothetical protein
MANFEQNVAYTYVHYPLKDFVYISRFKVMVFWGATMAAGLILVIPAELIFSNPHPISNKITYFVIAVAALVADYRLYKRGHVGLRDDCLVVHYYFHQKALKINEIASVDTISKEGAISKTSIALRMRSGGIYRIPGFSFRRDSQGELSLEPSVRLALNYLRLLSSN